MKILYALQATGNGYISRANEIIPVLEQYCDVDILLSGTQAEVGLNHFIKYRRKGLDYVRSKSGGIDLIKTLKQFRAKKFLQEVRSVPVELYDAVVNDFEPLSAWSCKQKGVACISLSHEYAILDNATPKPAKYDPLAWLVLRYYAPVSFGIGLHFKRYSEHIFSPVIRSEIRRAYLRNLGHYCVYLPEYSDKKMIRFLSEHKNIQWHIFSRKAEKSYAVNNCWIRPVNNYDFISSFSTCEGIICNAGFETPAEALYMNKKLLIVPKKGAYEQQCNAVSLQELGVPVMKKITSAKHRKIVEWLNSRHKVRMEYTDSTRALVEQLVHHITIAKDHMTRKLPEDLITATSLLSMEDFADEYAR